MIRKLFNRFNSLSIRFRFIFSFISIFIIFSLILILIIVDSMTVVDDNIEFTVKLTEDLLPLGVIIFVLVIFFAIFASNYFITQFKRINHLVKEYSLGRLEEKEEITTSDEISHVLEDLHVMGASILQKQKEINKAQEKIGNLYDNAPSMYCTMDSNGVILEVNMTLARTLFRSRESFIGTSFRELIAAEYKDIFGGDFRSFYLSTDPENGIEFKLHRENQEDIFVHMNWNFLTPEERDYYFPNQKYEDDGLIVFGARVEMTDITREKEAERRRDVLLESMSTLPLLLATNVAWEEMLIYIFIRLDEVIDFDIGTIILAPGEGEQEFKVAADYVTQTHIANAYQGKYYSSADPKIKILLETKESQVYDQFFLEDYFGEVYYPVIQSSFAVPLLVFGELIAVMSIDRDREVGFKETELQLIESFASLAVGAIQNLLLRAEVQERTIEVKQAFKELEAKDYIIQRELDMAGSIQQGILPSNHYFWHGICIASYYNAIGKVGGDFYDFFHLPQGQLGIFIADVSGHGVPAALVTAMAKISFGLAAQRYSSPKKILNDVNMEMVENVKTDDYMTVFFLTIDRNYRVTYTNAGHQIGLLFRKRYNKIEHLDTAGFFVGMMGEMGDSYEEAEVQLDFGDILLLYTDGIVECTNKQGEEYGVERLEELLIENIGNEPEKLRDNILVSVKKFSGKNFTKDDSSLIIIELDERYEEVVHASLLGQESFEAGSYQECIKLFNKALQIDDQNVEALLYTGEAYFRLEQYNESVNYFENYIELKTNNPNVYFHLGLCYYKLKKYQKAIDTNLKALEIDKNYVRAMHLLGLIYKKINQLEEAKRYFIEVLKIEPGNEKAKSEIKLLTTLS